MKKTDCNRLWNLAPLHQGHIDFDSEGEAFLRQVRVVVSGYQEDRGRVGLCVTIRVNLRR